MRWSLWMTVSVLAATASAPGFSQIKSPEQITCEITGECAQASIPEGQEREVGDLRGFDFNKPASAVEAMAMAKKAAAPRNAVAGVKLASVGKMSPAPRHLKSTDVMIAFALGSAEMTSDGRAYAANVAKSLNDPKLVDSKFIIAGHTDASGTHDLNVKLSQARAESVAAYLQSLGVEASRLEAKGFGPDQPLPGRSRFAPENRRVQIVPSGPNS